MGPVQLKRCGMLLLILGLTIIGVSLYETYRFSTSILTELMPGTFACLLGVYLIYVGYKQDPKGLPASLSSTSSGRISPFYYELEPVLLTQRSLPPIPKDIGRDYDPVVMDKV